MFEEDTHDFGNVPRGAKTEYRFKVTNKYEEDIHIASVRSSCGCTMPRIENDLLKTYQSGAIVCEFNTRSFIGSKSAVVTVVFDKPYYGEMQLVVKGNIRSDIVTEPGQIQFNEVDQGSEKATSVMISYAGSNNWEIKDVRSVNRHLAVSLERIANRTGRVEYEMKVRLKDTAPSGPFNDEIVLVTNDQQYNMVTIPVRGNVTPPLVTRPIELGTLPKGSSTQKFLIIQGKEPFEITKVECGDQRIAFEDPVPLAGGKVYRIPFEFAAGEQSGAFKEQVTVHTSLPGESVATTTVSGNVN